VVNQRVSGVVMAILMALPAWASAQLPGEPKAPPAYDITGDAVYRFARGAPDDRVRDAQRALQSRGYYEGPIDGLMTPEMRRAVWSFQKAEGFRLSGRLEPQTMTALGLTPPPPKDVPESGPDSQPSALPGDVGGFRSTVPRDLPAP
jgi:peptidoglycan hydrolase-like protein with peptidoglycan-binding domain